MRKDKTPLDYWNSPRAIPRDQVITDEEDRRKMEASKRQNSERSEETDRMMGRADRESGPSIMSGLPKNVQDDINNRLQKDVNEARAMEAKAAATAKAKKLATVPLFQKPKK